jgi:hypothetical protein
MRPPLREISFPPLQAPSSCEQRRNNSNSAEPCANRKRHPNPAVVDMSCCELDLWFEGIDRTDGVSDLVDHLHNNKEVVVSRLLM